MHRGHRSRRRRGRMGGCAAAGLLALVLLLAGCPRQIANLSRGLNGDIRAEDVGFRLLAVSMCNHDMYSGPDIPDPNNPNTTPDGEPRTVNGLFATKAAIQLAMDRHPTGDHFLYGTSAGAFGSYSVAWGLERQGIPATGLVADSGVTHPP